jgi:hypothetical protein
MSEEFEAGRVAGKAEERQKILDAIAADPNLIPSCYYTNPVGLNIFMAAKFTAIIDGTWVERVIPDETTP